MDDLAAVGRPELPGQVPGRPAQQTGKLCRVKVDQPAGHRVTVFVKEVDRIAGHELARRPP